MDVNLAEVAALGVPAVVAVVVAVVVVVLVYQGRLGLVARAGPLLFSMRGKCTYTPVQV